MRFRPVRLLVVLTACLAPALLVPPLPAQASGPVVSVQNYSFTPAFVGVAQGGTVTWQFHADHTTTSDQGFWDSGDRGSGAYVVVFRDAGTFGYHCSMHPSMTGAVRVPLTATGRPAVGFRVRWTARTTATPPNRRFDVQVRRSGATGWTFFRNATATHVGLFNPTRTGTYSVRARTRNVGTGVSRWSPVLTVRIS